MDTWDHEGDETVELAGEWRPYPGSPKPLKRPPILVWEWKALALPKGGDVRKPKQNDQAARVMLRFEGMKAIVYLWDTRAPVGEVVRPDPFAPVERVLIVVRSGDAGVGRWHRETRNVDGEYKRLFDEEPRTLKMVGLESHSDDVRDASAALFGPIAFERR